MVKEKTEACSRYKFGRSRSSEETIKMAGEGKNCRLISGRRGSNIKPKKGIVRYEQTKFIGGN